MIYHIPNYILRGLSIFVRYCQCIFKHVFFFQKLFHIFYFLTRIEVATSECPKAKTPYFLNSLKYASISSRSSIPTLSKQPSKSLYVFLPPRKSQNSSATLSSFSKSSIPRIVHRVYGSGS